MKYDNVEEILENIARIMNIKGKLRLLHKNKYLSLFINPPLRNRIILYKKKGEGFIGVKSKLIKEILKELNAMI